MNRTYLLGLFLFVLCLGACKPTSSSTPQPLPSATPQSLPTSAPEPLPSSTPQPLPSSTPQPLPASYPKIDRHPAAADWYRGALDSAPTYDPNSEDPWQVDLRAFDLSALDLRQSADSLAYASFDDRTIWPPADKMPADFDWQAIMEMGKNPGLGIRTLHEQGITGSGVGIAIIDQPLLVDHQEYAQQMKLYEEINVKPGTESQMHGPAVASIAVGKTVGVAPDADLYYIGTWTGDWGSGPNGFTYNFTYLAQSVRRILEINQELPEDRKMRVISMSIGWQSDQKGYDEITAAVNEAKAQGLLVICSSVEEIHGFKFHGLGRDPLTGPDEFESYEPGLWWAKNFYTGKSLSETLLVPMDSRTTASPWGVDEYVFYRQGGWSWSIPYIAGVYALAAQVDPSITPERFWELALETGRTVELAHEDKTYSFGQILDPVALVAALEE